MSDSKVIHPYQLIEFVGRGRPRKVKQIDCVPSSWVSYDPKIGKCICKFMAPPYKEEDTELLNSFIESGADAPESWPSYPAELKGQAKTYSEGTDKLEVLKTKKFVFTSESEVAPEKKAELLVKSIRTRKLKKDESRFSSLMKVATLPDTENEIEVSSPSSNDGWSETDTDDNTSVKIKNHRKPTKMYKRIAKSKSEATRKVVHKKQSKQSNQKQRSSLQDILENTDAMHNDVQWPKKIISNKPSWSWDAVQNDVQLRTKTSGNTKSSRSVKCMTQDIDTTPSNVKVPKDITEMNNNRIQGMQPRHEDSSETNDKLPSRCLPSKSSRMSSGLSFDSTEIESTTDSRKEMRIKTKNHKTANIDIVTNSDLNPLTSALIALQMEVKELSYNVRGIQTLFETSGLIKQGASLHQWCWSEEYGFEFPITSYEKFLQFDDKIDTDKKFRKDLMSTFHFCLDNNNIVSRSITNILKKFISRNVALNFTAVRQCEGKVVFKETRFFACIMSIVTAKHHDQKTGDPVTEKFVCSALGSVLTNAKDWDGHRSLRRK